MQGQILFHHYIKPFLLAMSLAHIPWGFTLTYYNGCLNAWKANQSFMDAISALVFMAPKINERWTE
jgi:hypothetical protein